MKYIALLLLCVLAGCCSHREGQVVMKDGEAYVFEKALTREQIQEGKEVEQLWLAYLKTNKPSKK